MIAAFSFLIINKSICGNLMCRMILMLQSTAPQLD